jgi:NAD(P)-dependent dehydrogenase (short-subunit alcohol dehydrogenase family)
MGGSFGTGSDGLDFFPGHGGVSGLVKTLAREWAGVRCRVVDLDVREAPRALATRLVAEARADDGWSEVGYVGGRRIRLRGMAAPLDHGASSRIELKPGEPVIVTGGARGITASITAELARRWRPALLLLGRSPLPSPSEDREIAGISSLSELKAVLHARLRREGRSVSPGDLERAYQSAIQAREIRQNLEIFRSTGSTVEYATVDVSDGNALASVLDGWRRRFGDPVGLIHGAGVIKDKLIRDKTLETFDLVLGTKLDGALNLARLLKPDAIRFAALFSSIAGRFGNAGQADYAAANEVLNKLAIWLDRKWQGRVVSMNWGPWSGVGMVSELEGHLGGRGLQMIPPEIGRTLLLDELRFGRKGDVEVIAAGNLGTLADPIEPARLAEVS